MIFVIGFVGLPYNNISILYNPDFGFLIQLEKHCTWILESSATVPTFLRRFWTDLLSSYL